MSPGRSRAILAHVQLDEPLYKRGVYLRIPGLDRPSQAQGIPGALGSDGSAGHRRDHRYLFGARGHPHTSLPARTVCLIDLVRV